MEMGVGQLEHRNGELQGRQRHERTLAYDRTMVACRSSPPHRPPLDARGSRARQPHELHVEERLLPLLADLVELAVLHLHLAIHDRAIHPTHGTLFTLRSDANRRVPTPTTQLS